jgi:hypothetical protein
VLYLEIYHKRYFPHASHISACPVMLYNVCGSYKKGGNPSNITKTLHRRRISKDTEQMVRNGLKPGQEAAMAHLVQPPCHRLVFRFPGKTRVFLFLHSFDAVSGLRRAQYSVDNGREAISSGLERPGRETE